MTALEGPYFEDLVMGQSSEAPGVTLTEAHATFHQALFGDRLKLTLDHELSRAVTGHERPLAHPMLVCNVAIGQSTELTQRVKANLFYRGLILRRSVHLGDTLKTHTKVVGLRQNRSKPGRAATGVAALEITTVNQRGEIVLHFWRCAMLPCRDREAALGPNDNLDWIPERIDEVELMDAVPRWSLPEFRNRNPGVHFAQLEKGDSYPIAARDTITSAPELARLTLNMAAAHVDAGAGYSGERLVYGGHTASVAFAQMMRRLPNVLTLIAWQSCNHLAPVFEGDVLRSDCAVLRKVVLEEGGGLVRLQLKTHAQRPSEQRAKNSGNVQVLDWDITVLMA
jgi:acyl dehydratase